MTSTSSSSNNDNTELTLYHFRGASSMATNILLHWTQQKANVVKAADSFSSLQDQYASTINPAHAVPALVLPSGNILTQNVAVLQYVAKKGNRQDLVGGDDLEDQAEVLKWSSFMASDLHSSFWVIFFTPRYTTSKDPKSLEETKAAGVALVHKKLVVMEHHMEDRKYFVTEEKTLVDAQAYVFLTWVVTFFPDKLSKYPNLSRFFEIMSEDNGVKDALRYETKEYEMVQE